MWFQFTSFTKEIQGLACVLPYNLAVNFPLWLHCKTLLMMHNHMPKLETPYQKYPAVPLFNGIFFILFSVIWHEEGTDLSEQLLC